MTEQQTQLLAEYLTSSRVVEYSLALERPSTARGEAAREFFALRAAFGVLGYPTAEEAAHMIRLATRERS